MTQSKKTLVKKTGMRKHSHELPLSARLKFVLARNGHPCFTGKTQRVETVLRIEGEIVDAEIWWRKKRLHAREKSCERTIQDLPIQI